MADWKIPYYAESTAAVVKHNWLLLVHGPNYTHDFEEAGDFPDYYTRHDQVDNRGPRHR